MLTVPKPGSSKPKPLARVLIIDDDSEIVGLLRESFEQDGWKVSSASDGKQALDIMKTEKFDAILSDVTMPKMNGIEFVGHAKMDRLNKNAPIFIISGTLESSHLKKINAIGVANIIVKPFNPEAVVAKVRAKYAGTAPVNKQPAPTYDTEIIKCILHSMQDVVYFYLGASSKIGKPYLKNNETAKGYFTALVPLYQEDAKGSVAFTCDVPFLHKLFKSIMGLETQKAPDEFVHELAGEMCNQIVEKLRVYLGKQNYQLNVGVPQVIIGDGHKVIHPLSAPVIVVPMENQDCQLLVEFTMSGQLAKTA